MPKYITALTTWSKLRKNVRQLVDKWLIGRSIFNTVGCRIWTGGFRTVLGTGWQCEIAKLFHDQGTDYFDYKETIYTRLLNLNLFCFIKLF